MKIDIINNRKVLVKFSKKKFELHPLWLRERANSTNLVDPLTEQRVYDPSSLKKNIIIKKAILKKNSLNVEFSDGINSKFKINELSKELNTEKMKKGSVDKKILWNSKLENLPSSKFNENSESKNTYKMLKEFYKYGFVIINKVPTKNNFIVKFANSIGSIRPTNFGIFFDVKSVRKYNDLAYTPRHLYPHTDNPYRKPIPCIQMLHCIENEVSGGLSTLVDGFAVAEYLKKKFKKYFDILTKTKVRFRFIDKNVILENWGEIIELDENKKIKQIRFNTKVDFVPHLNKKDLDIFYRARKKMGEFCSSKKFEIKFKLMPGDLLMMDNYRTLHGRTSYDPSEGKRHLKGCYIDYDSSEGKLMHLQRKFK